MILADDFSNSNKHDVAATSEQNRVEINNQLDFFIKTIRDLVSNDQLEDAAQIMRPFVEPLDDDLGEMAIGFNARLKALNRDRDEEVITMDDYRINRAKIRRAMLNFVNDELPVKLELKQRMALLMSGGVRSSDAPPSAFTAPLHGVVEKVIGNKNEMISTTWLAKALLASKSVCRVLVGGRADGTGFLLKGGYFMTNAHVLPNAAAIAKTEIEFNYEEGTAQTVRYKLDANDVRRSPVTALDYCIVKVVDNKKTPLKQWGYLELETEMEVRPNDAANIVQHPWGGVKQLAFRANQIRSVWGDKIFYVADTDQGSSGSPVFNDNWKVVALHSRGADASDGGLQINEAGDMEAINQGFSILAIVQDARSTFD